MREILYSSAITLTGSEVMRNWLLSINMNYFKAIFMDSSFGRKNTNRICQIFNITTVTV